MAIARSETAQVHASGDYPASPSGLFRVHVGTHIYGPIGLRDFRRVPGFTLRSPVAPAGTEEWRPAYQAIDLNRYFSYEVENGFTLRSAMDRVGKAMSEGNGKPDVLMRLGEAASASLPTVKHVARGIAASAVIGAIVLAWPHLKSIAEKSPPFSPAPVVAKVDRFLTYIEP